MPNLLLALTVFISTNVDDLFILLAFFSRRDYAPWQIVAGQLLGFAVIMAVCVVGATLAWVIPEEWVRLLAIFPLLIGLREAWEIWKDRDDDDELPPVTPQHGFRKVLSVALVTIANSGDNIGVYIPLFVAQGRVMTIGMIGLFALFTLALCAFPLVLMQHPQWHDPLQRYGQRLLPMVLVGLGLLILSGVL